VRSYAGMAPKNSLALMSPGFTDIAQAAKLMFDFVKVSSADAMISFAFCTRLRAAMACGRTAS
jgi:hypothetical protein